MNTTRLHVARNVRIKKGGRCATLTPVVVVLTGQGCVEVQ